MINHTASEDTLDFFVTKAMQGSPKATPECVTAFSATDFRGDLAKITVPTMIIHGTGGATVPIDVSGRRAAKLVANGQFIEYEGQAHGLNATAPEKLNADLLSFLNDSDKAG